MDYGIMALVPPVVAILIALKTKQTLLSLFIGVWIGTTIIYNWNPLVGFVSTITDFIIPSIADPWNAGLLLLVTLAGGFVHILRVTGAAQSFAQAATKRIKTRKGAQTTTWASAFAFSYTEPVLILGTIMRPITDRLKVSRVKLAYILDSMGSSLAAMSPISSYGPFITGLIAVQITAIGLSENPWSLFIAMIPYNLYGIFAMITVLFVIRTGLDIGPMYHAEKRAVETGKLVGENDKPLMVDEEELPEDYNVSMKNFLVPMGLLFATIFGVIFWSGDILSNGFRNSFIEGNIVLAISAGFVVGSIGAIGVAVITKLYSFAESVDEWTKGIKNLVIVPIILVLAWSIGGVAGEMGLGSYLSSIVDSYLPGGFVPALIFLLGAIIAFSTGSSWGVFAIMMPIAIPMADLLGVPLPLIIGAVISGGLFGDHCSPISDTTIMASTGAACDHIEHVNTQLPYALTVGAGSFVGFLVGGFTVGWLGIIVTIVVIGTTLYLLNKHVSHRVDDSKVDNTFSS
ncbi:Na+/H+ antiporter NhaC family protein [Alkalihalobacillus sp. LMS39]|uniref:Na+/H+ antiporter NhaC family protein n=1 Tax=Alkalihalobacillus sp. LMS39 TaxID=2924032 RepID=UPI001FB25092|nr:Na+/H+ antiporter NhaC family protein [Alkalihalobacillus sp. LMS39]UOE94019.1 sodium:proton antiporter [Alkalihalobacillus sp. LMS39]